MPDDSHQAPRIVAIVKRNTAGSLALSREVALGPDDRVTLVSVPTGLVVLVGAIDEGDPALAALLREI